MDKTKMKIAADMNVLISAAVQDEPIKEGRRPGSCNSVILLLCLSPFFVNLFGSFPGAKKSAPDVWDAIHRLMNSANVVVNRPAVESGLLSLRQGGDFADGVIAYEGSWLGGEDLVSFDSEAVSLLQAQGTRARLLQ